jgi:hypothetical protein
MELSTSPQPVVAAAKGSLSRLYAVLIWAPMLAVVIGAASFWHFVSFAFTSSPALNGLILAVMLWGAVTMLLHVRGAYQEDRVFFSGVDWLKRGVWSDEPPPRLGPKAYVQGMLERLEKLGLGHQVYVQSAAMEPELDALGHHFEKKQELSQFLVGLMVGLGLLGTFIGLLETLIATSGLIATIANGVGGSGSGGGMESEFARIVGGLQKPLEAMGTAFSASMFGLVGSIMLGFQMILVRKTEAALIDNIREEVLSLAEKTKVNANVEITERFLANLLADVMEQHRKSEESMLLITDKLSALLPRIEQASEVNSTLARAMLKQVESADKTTAVLGQFTQAVPLMAQVAQASQAVHAELLQTRTMLDDMAAHLPGQEDLSAKLSHNLRAVQEMAANLGKSQSALRDLTTEVRLQGDVAKRLDATLWNSEKNALKTMLDKATS